MYNNRPNILIFMTDHQRADTVLPDSPTIMPNVKKMGSEGIFFTDTYCPMAHCCPARATFFTGLYPSRSGVWNNVSNAQALSRGLKEGVRTFGEDLKEAGYNLGYAGKWHVSAVEGPAERGWSELTTPTERGSGMGRGWEDIKRAALREGNNYEDRQPGEIIMKGYLRQALYGINDNGKASDERSVNEAVKAIRNFSKEGEPWAVFVGANMPHAPYQVPQKYVDMYDLEDISLPPSYHDELKDKPNYYRKLREMNFDQLSELEARDAIRHYWAMCTYLDDLFGKLLDVLKETNQVENTLVLYCSDHGDYAGDHGLFHKGVPSFLGAYNVPAVVRWPKGIKNPGRQVDAFVSLADFAPTFTELAGMRPDPTLTGKSLVPFLLNQQPTTWRDAMHTQCNGVENYFTQRMIITKQHKYVYNGFDYDELYDLEKDPHEMVNLIKHPEYEEIKLELVKKMWKFAYQENDPLGTVKYIMVNTAPLGSQAAFWE